MSNTRKIREQNGGKLTRPRGLWTGKARQSHLIASADNTAHQRRALTLSHLAVSQLSMMVGRQGDANRRAGS